MKKGFILILLFSFGINLFGSALYGKRFYMKNLVRFCQKDGIENGAMFAQQHTQDEWDQLVEENKLLDEWKRICPSGSIVFDSLRQKDKKNLFDFVWTYASDSGEIPSCSE